MAHKTWGGRFTGDTDNRVVSLHRVDQLRSPALSRTTSSPARPTPACWPRSACSPATRRSRSVAALERDPRRNRARRIRLLHRARRHSHAHRGGADRTARRRGPQAAHRPQPQRPGRHRSSSCGPATPSTRSTRCCSICSGPCSNRRRSDQRPGPARLHAHAAGPAGAGRPLFPGLRRKVSARPRTPGRLPAARQRALARRRGSGRHLAADRPRQRLPASSASIPWPPTASTSPATAISCWSSSST